MDMHARFDAHTNRPGLRADGYAVACVGTARVAYVAFHGGWTYDERKAQVWKVKQDACDRVATLDADHFKFSRVVPLDADAQFHKGGKLPTVDGY